MDTETEQAYQWAWESGHASEHIHLMKRRKIIGTGLLYIPVSASSGIYQANISQTLCAHIEHLQSKIKSRIGFLLCNKASFTHAVKHTLVKLTILPDPSLRRYHLKNSPQRSTQQTGCSLSQCHPFYHQSPYTTHHCNLYALVGWPSLLICCQTH